MGVPGAVVGVAVFAAGVRWCLLKPGQRGLGGGAGWGEGAGVPAKAGESGQGRLLPAEHSRHHTPP